MKLALIGYGKMGKTFEKVAQEKGHEIVARFWDAHPLEVNEKNVGLLKSAILVDFSSGEVVLHNVQCAGNLGLSLIEGTTGWQDQLSQAKAIVEKTGIGMIYGSNFSIGVNLFYLLVQKAGELFSKFAQYIPFIEEAHHQFKKDAPSGTAIELFQIMQKAYPSTAIPITSVRAGYIPGEHRVSFDSPFDQVRVEHIARGREGFAEGALLAAEWIQGKKGFYHFRDVLDKILSECSL